MARTQLPLFFLLLLIGALVGCELLGFSNHDENADGLTACDPTDMTLTDEFLDPDTSGTLYYLTGMKLMPAVKLSDVVAGRPELFDRIEFLVYPNYLRLDTTEAFNSIPDLSNEDDWQGEIMNPHTFNISLTISKPFYYKNELVQPGKNILDFAIGDRDNHGISRMFALTPFSIGNFRVDTSFVNFEAGCYVVRAGFEDNYGHAIWDTTRVYIDLK